MVFPAHCQGFMQQLQPKPFNPRDISATVGWFDPSDSANYTLVGGKFSAMTDKASGVSLTQGTAGSRLTYAATGLNSLPAMQATAEGQHLAYTGLPTGWPSGATEGWIFTIANISDAGHISAAVMEYGDSGTTNGVRTLGVEGHDSGSSPGRWTAGVRTDDDLDAYASGSFSSTALIAAKFTATGPGIWKNGVSAMTAARVPATASGSVRIGQRTMGIGGVVGYFGDIIVTTALTSAEQALIEGYIAWKYNLASTVLPVGHTWRSVSPTI